MTVINPPDWKLANRTFVHCPVCKPAQVNCSVLRLGILNLSLSYALSSNSSFPSRYRELHGSGKSSLISALLGEMKTLSGVANTRGKIAYVPQQAKFSIYKLFLQNQLQFIYNL
jgi:hypothetical protein